MQGVEKVTSTQVFIDLIEDEETKKRKELEGKEEGDTAVTAPVPGSNPL